MTPEELKAYLSQHGYTREAFAKLFKRDRSTVQKWLKGTHKIPAYVELHIQERNKLEKLQQMIVED